MTGLSLIGGGVPLVLGIAAFATLVGAVLERRRRWLLGVLALAAGSGAATVGVGMASGIEHSLGSSFPKSFFVWAALPVFAVGITVAGWRSRPARWRVLSVSSVVLLALFGADQVNAHYAYLPTVGDAIGLPLHGQVAPAALVTLRDTSTQVARNSGVVVPLRIPGTVSHFHGRRAFVWLPPAYFAMRRPDLPFVMVLAGVPGDPSNMLRAGHADRIAAAYARVHGGVAPILVFPDQNGAFTKDTECVDGPRGDAETYLTVDVRRAIERRLEPALAGRRWAIVGFSEGGTCALTLTLAHPHLFGTFVDIAGDLRPNAASGPGADQRTIGRLYGGRAGEWIEHDPLTLLHERAARGVSGWIVSGLGDRRASDAGRTLVAAARRAGVDVRLVSVPGGHSFTTVVRALQLELPQVADRLLASDGSNASVSEAEPSTSRRAGTRG